MRECSSCGEIKEDAFFLPKNIHDRERGIFTRACLPCREQRNKRRRIWYATHEQVRIGRAPIP